MVLASPLNGLRLELKLICCISQHTSKEHALHVAFADLGPDLRFVESLHERYGAPGSVVEPTSTTQNDTHWDSLYPVSTFLRTYKFALPSVDCDWPRMQLEEMESPTEAGLRKLNLRMSFVGFFFLCPFTYSSPSMSRTVHTRHRCR